MTYEENDSRPIVSYINQAWADIRSFISNIWQVAAIGLTVIALSLSALISSLTSEIPLDSIFIIIILSFTSIFAALVAYTIGWFKEEIAERVNFLDMAENKLKKIRKPTEVVSGVSVYGKTGPLRYLLYLFYVLFLIFALVSMIWTAAIGAPLLIALIPLIPSYLTSEIVSVIIGVILSFITALLFSRRYRRIREVEKQAYVGYSYLEFEREILQRLNDVAKDHNANLESHVVHRDAVSGRIRVEFDAILKVNNVQIPVEITSARHIYQRLGSLFMQAAFLNSKHGVIIQRSIYYEERKYGNHSILIIRHDNDFNLIFKWLRKNLKSGK